MNAKSPSIGDVIWSVANRLEKYLQNNLELEKVDGQKPVEELTDVERLAAYLKYANV